MMELLLDDIVVGVDDDDKAVDDSICDSIFCLFWGCSFISIIESIELTWSSSPCLYSSFTVFIWWVVVDDMMDVALSASECIFMFSRCRFFDGFDVKLRWSEGFIIAIELMLVLVDVEFDGQLRLVIQRKLSWFWCWDSVEMSWICSESEIQL